MQTSKNPKKFTIAWKVLQSLLILGGLLYVYQIQEGASEKAPAGIEVSPSESDESVSSEPAAPVFNTALFSTRLREADQRSQKRIQEADRRFKARLRELQGHQGFLQWLEETAVACGREMQGDRDLLTLIRYSAEDRLRKTHQVESWVDGVLKSQLDPWLNAFTQELHLASLELDQALTASNEQLAYELAMAAHETHAPMAVMDPELLRQDLLNFSMGNVALGGGILVALSPLEIHGVITSPLLRRVPQMVSRMVSRIFHKQIAMATVAATAPVVDGPLPVGDIVAGVVVVGGTAWTIAEWNRLKRDLQNRVETGVRKELLSVRTQGFKVMKKQGDQRIAESRQIQKGLLARAHEEERTALARR